MPGTALDAKDTSKGQDRSRIVGRNFNTTLSITCRKSRQKNQLVHKRSEKQYQPP